MLMEFWSCSVNAFLGLFDELTAYTLYAPFNSKTDNVLAM